MPMRILADELTPWLHRRLRDMGIPDAERFVVAYAPVPVEPGMRNDDYDPAAIDRASAAEDAEAGRG